MGSRHQKNNKRIVRNLKDRNAGTKKKSPKQGLTRAEYLTIELPRAKVPTSIDQTELIITKQPNLWSLQAQFSLVGQNDIALLRSNLNVT